MSLLTNALGTDTEFIITNKGIPVSVIDKLGGSKEEPLSIPNGAFQEDNVLAEINITPAQTYTEWENNISSVYNQLAVKLNSLFNYHVSELASTIYPAIELMSPQALIFGCDPDYNSWTGEINEVPLLPRKLKGFRSAGGHIHVSYPNPTPENSVRLNNIIDSILGVQSIVYDKNTDRKKLYGKAGAMRFKDYGLENRVLSNFWIFSISSRKWVYESLKVCLNIFNANDDRLVVTTDVPLIINKGNYDEALRHMDKLSNQIGITMLEDY